MWSSAFLNEYGATHTPLAERMFDSLRPIQRDIREWAKSIEDPMDWAYLASVVYSMMSALPSPDESTDGLTDSLLANYGTAYKLGRNYYWAWDEWATHAVSGPDKEVSFYHANLDLMGLLAEIQLEKGMKKYKETTK